MSSSHQTWLTLIAPILLAGCATAPTERAPERRAPERQSVEEQPAETASAPTPDAPPSEALEDRGQDEEAREAPKTRAVTITLATQQFVYTEDGEVVRRGPISSGAEGYPTPIGTFSVLSKDADKVSSRYTNQLGMQAWMPYSIQFHGNYFLHEGWLPGYPDSHGCVRLGEKDARFLFERMRSGDPIKVSR